MKLDELKRNIAEKLIEDLDWDDVAIKIAENISEDVVNMVAEKLGTDLTLDEITDKIIEELY